MMMITDSTKFEVTGGERTLWGVLADGQALYAMSLHRAQAEMAVTILENEGVPLGRMDFEVRTDVTQMITQVACTYCGKFFMACQMHNDRCPADQS